MANTRHSMNAFYRDYSAQFIYALIVAIFGLMAMIGVVLYQVLHRPLPQFYAVATDGSKLPLFPYTEPSLVPGALLQWAGKATVLAYTFNFVNYDKAIEQAHPYFTAGGWRAYTAAITQVVDRVKKGQLFVSGVVSGPPVISSQGDLLMNGIYTWRVQLPFLVTYLSAEASKSEHYYVLLTIVKVPTIINPDGVGIEKFEMVGAGGR